jgi:hypothetical protein
MYYFKKKKKKKTWPARRSLAGAPGQDAQSWKPPLRQVNHWIDQRSPPSTRKAPRFSSGASSQGGRHKSRGRWSESSPGSPPVAPTAAPRAPSWVSLPRPVLYSCPHVLYSYLLPSLLAQRRDLSGDTPCFNTRLALAVRSRPWLRFELFRFHLVIRLMMDGWCCLQHMVAPFPFPLLI